MKLASLFLLNLFSTTAFAATSPGIEGLIISLVYLGVIILILAAIWWLAGYIGLPEPFNKVIRIIVGLVALLVLLYFLLGMVGLVSIR